MSRSRILSLAACLFLIALAWLAGPSLLGRAFRAWELLALAAVVLAVLAWRHRRARRRERQDLERLRDSALW
jgi:Flp pilus assembly protein TadB